MKLLSAALSPFAARVRLAIYAKSLPVEIAPSGLFLPTGEKSPQYLAINPIGKVPALVLDDGTAIPESDTIVEFLADAFPAAGLRPRTAPDIARARLLARIMELYVMTPAGALFGQFDPQSRNQAAVDTAIAKTAEGLSYLDLFMTGDSYAVGDSITTADCALAPYLFFFPETLGRYFGAPSLIAGHAKVAAYWSRVQQDPVVARLLAEMREGLANSRLKHLLGEPA